MRILIIGGIWLISTAMTRQLLEKGVDVTLFNRGKTPPRFPEGATFLHGDRRDYTALPRPPASSCRDARLRRAMARCCTPPMVGATIWVMQVIHPVNPQLAVRTVDELIADFQQSGVYECVHPKYWQPESYVVSVCNPLGAARQLWDKRTPGCSSHNLSDRFRYGVRAVPLTRCSNSPLQAFILQRLLPRCRWQLCRLKPALARSSCSGINTPNVSIYYRSTLIAFCQEGLPKGDCSLSGKLGKHEITTQTPGGKRQRCDCCCDYPSSDPMRSKPRTPALTHPAKESPTLRGSKCPNGCATLSIHRCGHGAISVCAVVALFGSTPKGRAETSFRNGRKVWQSPSTCWV
jgi:hypothetical protein